LGKRKPPPITLLSRQTTTVYLFLAIVLCTFDCYWIVSKANFKCLQRIILYRSLHHSSFAVGHLGCFHVFYNLNNTISIIIHKSLYALKIILEINLQSKISTVNGFPHIWNF
jgi:hypothetical protein